MAIGKGAGPAPGPADNGGGAATAVPGPAPVEPITNNALAKFADRVTKWIPGDALALYLPGVSFFEDPNPWWLVTMTVVSGLLVLSAAFATGEKIRKEVYAAAGLGSMAFAIWSLSVPSSGWQAIPVLHEKKFMISLVGALAGALFALVAEGITNRMARTAPG
jgi:hypothetical protein